MLENNETRAFDTADHNTLLPKCFKYCLKCKTGQLLKSYLEDREQFVCYKGENCSTKNIFGLVLGPLLFLRNINYIAEMSHYSKILPYADDTDIFAKYEQTEHINDLHANSIWLESNKLTINFLSNKLTTNFFFKNKLLLGPKNSSDKKN